MNFDVAVTWIYATVFAYFIGSIPFGMIIGKLIGRTNVRNYGSKSIGATNVARTLGLKLGLIVLVLDLSKGASAVVLSSYFTGLPLPLFSSNPISLQVALAGVFVAIGHCWPIWTNFKGGKGIAPGLGALFVVSPLGGLVSTSGILTAGLTGWISLGSLIGAWLSGLTIIALVIFGYYNVAYLAFAIPTLIILTFRHSSNIQRLIKGQEKPLFKGILNLHRIRKSNTEEHSK